MISFRFKHVCIESCAVNLPPYEVSSEQIEDKLAAVYERLQIPFGTLDKLSGIKTRYYWDQDVFPSEVATGAARNALEKCGIDQKHIQAIFSCSVTRDFFEPATSCLVHKNLGMPETCMALDISNACIGFSNGIIFLSNLIETGIVKAGIVVSGETMSRVVNNTTDKILTSPDLTREELIKLLPTYTLGSGSVAFVLCHDSIATQKHRIVGGVARSATEFSDLCNGNGDFSMRQRDECRPVMHTESSKLIASAASLGGRMWKDASPVLGWSREQLDHIFCHQVGKQVGEAFYREMGLDLHKEFSIYKKYGNMVSAALPSAFTIGVEEKGIKQGEKILLTAFGSGLNSIFLGVEW